MPVRETADRVAALLERTLAGRNVRIRVTGDGDARVFGAEHAIETVCLNLLINAADAMPAGGEVEVTVEALPEAVHLTVTDGGSGVPAELKERIFEPFFTTKGAKGTGLGLSLCRSIVERHGGRLWVEDVTPRGSRFVIVWPRSKECRP